MKRMLLSVFVSFFLMVPFFVFSQTGEILLTAPGLKSGKPLMQALSERSSNREYSERELSEEHLSGLLWAACGINRPESGKRTAPSARNWQDVQVYVFMKQGIYLYDEAGHKLVPVVTGDHRKASGMQDFVEKAPVNLVYVSDYDRMKEAQDKSLYSGMSTGYISQNVYLYCASEGLNTVMRASVDREVLHKLMNLKPSQHVVGAQSLGYRP
ncbi:MAG TPA: SagB/ThcOx family dehydrogenase [Lentimicrobium sp.]|nr:SagB/ThcOx family dehydrogenase [Lentimicrobium sp.]